MKTFRRALIGLISIAVVLYAGLCIWFYTSQEKAIFKTVKHPTSYKYHFDQQFSELNIPMKDGKKLNGILFKANVSKGLVLWLPGGRGMLDSIGRDAQTYTNLGYDIFMLNFRGFGKSEGKIESEAQIDSDLQSVYDFFRKDYQENIHVFGYSLGTGPASFLAAKNSPKSLVLIAPYYNFTEFLKQSIPYLPVSILSKYKFPVDEYLMRTKCPVYLIHGDADEKINPQISIRLKELLKPTDKLFLLKGQKHNGFEHNPEYLSALKLILADK